MLLLRNICVAISFHVTVAVAAVGQDPGKALPSQSVNQRLQASLAKQVPETKTVTVTWNVSRYGYVATYVIENVHYLTLYSADGEFVESFRQLPWDDRVPDIIRMEFDSSEYRSFTVTGYWEGTREDNRHYFLQMLDRQSVSRNAWCDENGKFSASPFIE